MKYITISFFAIVLLMSPWIIQNYPQAMVYVDTVFNYVGENVAAVILHKPVSIAELKYTYNSAPQTKNKVRVLVMPGHEPNYGGAEFGNLKERDMTVELANDLAGFLRNNGHYEVIVPRTADAWSPVFADYFKNHWNDIIAFFKQSKDDELNLVTVGSSGQTGGQKGGTSSGTASPGKVFHNTAPQDVAYRLYGINKWENENNIDIAIHIHFNDYPRKNTSIPGDYSGFTIYVPEKEYANSTTTRAVADTVYKRLAKYNAASNLPVENNGYVEEPDLIAIGAHNTADAASMLIEYGYIYEPQFADPKVRASTLQDLAFQTYLGLQDFFGSGNDVSFAYDTLMLPHQWKSTLSQSKGDSDDVLALQTALLLDGLYPGQGKTKNDCPRSGKIGPRTLSAISAFQKKYNITGEQGIVGEKTEKVLNDKYSVPVQF